MILKYLGLAATAVVLAGCWNRRQADIVSGGEVVGTRSDIATGNAIPSGATIATRIDQTLSTDGSEVGDRITATVSTSLMAANGDVVVPQGARVYGEITGLDESNDIADRALIQVKFNAIEFRGQRYLLPTTVIDVGDVVQKRKGTGEIVQPGTAGTVIGAIITGGELTAIVRGGGFGATAGTIISLGVGDVEHVIPAGTPILLRADATTVIHPRP